MSVISDQRYLKYLSTAITPYNHLYKEIPRNLRLLVNDNLSSKFDGITTTVEIIIFEGIHKL